MTSIFLYIANILDYIRIVSLIISLFYAKTDPIMFVSLYAFSMSMDLFDGMAARHFNQTSYLGMVLDMAIDRVTTASLLFILSNLYPDFYVAFCSLMILDIGSHWIQVYSALISSNKGVQNHKELKERFYLLGLYYNNKLVLFVCCVGAELFLLQLYLVYFYKGLAVNSLFNIILWISGGIYIYKQFMSVLQLISSSLRIVDIQEQEKKELKN